MRRREIDKPQYSDHVTWENKGSAVHYGHQRRHGFENDVIA